MLNTSERICVSVSSSVSFTCVSNSFAGVRIVCMSTLWVQNDLQNDLPNLNLPYLPAGEDQRYGKAMRGQGRFAWKSVYAEAMGGNALAIVPPRRRLGKVR